MSFWDFYDSFQDFVQLLRTDSEEALDRLANRAHQVVLALAAWLTSHDLPYIKSFIRAQVAAARNQPFFRLGPPPREGGASSPAPGNPH